MCTVYSPSCSLYLLHTSVYPVQQYRVIPHGTSRKKIYVLEISSSFAGRTGLPAIETVNKRWRLSIKSYTQNGGRRAVRAPSIGYCESDKFKPNVYRFIHNPWSITRFQIRLLGGDRIPGTTDRSGRCFRHLHGLDGPHSAFASGDGVQDEGGDHDDRIHDLWIRKIE